MSASASTISPWLPDAIADVDRLVASVGPALRGELSTFLSRLGTVNGGTSLLDMLSRPASTPFTRFIDACAADLGLTAHPGTALLGRSAVMLYAYVRIQDDIVDEPQLVPRSAVYVAEALLGEHLSLFAAAIPDARAFAHRTEIMRRFADVAAAEVADREQGGSASADWIGKKALPMVIPSVGLAYLAGRPQLADTFVRFIEEAGTALQLVNDLYNAPEDAAQGRPTPVLRWLGEAARSGSSLRATLLQHPVLERALEQARRHVANAEELAKSHNLRHTTNIAHLAGQMVEAAPKRLLRLMLGMAAS